MEAFQNQVAEIFSQLLGYRPDISFTQTDTEILVELEVDPQDSGLLIGYHGEMLAAIQLILNVIYAQHNPARLPVRLNINNYREQRQLSLERLADTTVAKVLARQQPLPVYHLSSYERRLIHLYLSEHPEVETYSQGEGSQRILIIAPKSPTTA